MKKKREDLKILILQSRLAKEMRDQELWCLLKYSGLKKSQFVTHYVIENRFNLKDMSKFDALIVWWTWDFEVKFVKKTYPLAYKDVSDIAHYCRVKKIPVMSICIQYLADIFGWEIKTDSSRKEVWTYDIKLTKEAKNDLLFHDMPSKFLWMVWHKDYISKIPAWSVLLAYSDLCPTHAYRTGDKEYTLQFHPELDVESIIERINFYSSYTSEDPDVKNNLIKTLKETPYPNTLLKKFIERVVLR